MAGLSSDTLSEIALYHFGFLGMVSFVVILTLLQIFYVCNHQKSSSFLELTCEWVVVVSFIIGALISHGGNS